MRRAQVYKFLAAAVLSLLLAVTSAAAFSDTEGHRAEAAIDKWSQEYHILTGYADGTFRPDQFITRGAFAGIMNRFMHYRERAAVSTFSDLRGNFWEDEILRLNAAGVYLGNNGLSRPTESITRQQAITMIARAFEIRSETGIIYFPTDPDFSNYAKEPVSAMLELGYLENVVGEMLRPNDPITRWEIVQIFDNLVEALVQTPDLWTDNVNGNLMINSESGANVSGCVIRGHVILAPGVTGPVVLDSVSIGGKVRNFSAVSPAISIQPTATVTSAAATPTPIDIPTATPTPIYIPTATPTPIYIPSATPTPIYIPSATPTPIYVPTATPTPIYIPTATATPIYIPTATATPIYIPTATATPTPAAWIDPDEPFYTATPTPTLLPTPTFTPTPTPLFTPTPFYAGPTSTPTPTSGPVHIVEPEDEPYYPGYRPTATATPIPFPTAAAATPVPVPTAFTGGLTITQNPSSPLRPSDIYNPSPTTGTFSYNGSKVPIYAGVETRQVRAGDFAWSGNRLRYTGSRYQTSFGVDVSAHNNRDRGRNYNYTINWTAAKNAGVQFVFVRVAGRGTSTGELYEDEFYKRNIDGALAAGLETGVYVFSQAISIEEALEEADFVLQRIRGYSQIKTVSYDWEINSSSNRSNRVSKEMATACAVAFSRRVEAAGYRSLVYQARDVEYFKYDQGAIAPYLTWYPQYPSTSTDNPYPNVYYQMDIWQFSDRCSVSGIGSTVDANIWFRNR